VIGAAGHGVRVRVRDVHSVAALGADKPNRHQFVIVAIELASDLDTDLELSSSWFSLETPRAEYPEIAVLHPALAAELHDDARALELPFTTLAAGAHTTLALLFDVPPGDHAILHVGADELRLGVDW
jgi:hypothetical protein